MKGVKAARVHIVLQDTASFRRSRQVPSASVIVRTESAGDFSSAQAIRHLVAAAVPGLTIDQVTVLNTDGTILASGGESASAAPGKMVSLEKTFSKELQDNIAKTLAPYLGLGNFEISVAARLNTDKRQTNETAYNPESRVERSVRVVKETGSQQNSANRTAVGAEQNVPAEQQGASGGDQSKRTNERREELTNYEVGTKTTSTVSEGYRLESLTVAVVVNRKRLVAALGDNAGPEAVDKQLKEVERLVASAAGIDTKRGDRVSVAALEFIDSGHGTRACAVDRHGRAPAPPHRLPRQRRGYGRHDGAAHLVRRAAGDAGDPGAAGGRGRQDPDAAGTGAAAMADQSAGARIAAGEVQPNLIADLTSKRGRTPQKRLEQMADFDEEQAVAILKQWMHGAKSA
jgi:flagellar M-ring protein FliF